MRQVGRKLFRERPSPLAKIPQYVLIPTTKLSVVSDVKPILAVAFAALLVTGCGVANIKSDAPIHLKGKESILLLGFRPNSRVHLIRGAVNNGVWTRPQIDVPEVNTFPDKGYILVKVKATSPNERLGVSLIFPSKFQSYGPCMDSVSPTFELKAGVVNYVGDLTYSFEREKMQISTSIDEPSAKSFLQSNHPNLVALYESHPLVPMKANSHVCDQGMGTFIIPIYIPAHR